MIVQVDLPPPVIWALCEAAEQRGVTSAELAGEVLAERFNPKPTPRYEVGQRTRERVAELHALGMTDEEMGVELDRAYTHVGRVRCALGLKKNRKKES